MGMLLMIKEGRTLAIESIATPQEPIEPSAPIVDPNNTANDGQFGIAAFGQAIFAAESVEEGAA
tara:strand:- start:1350 stop:1541 length:192 start_codon:yes stop_codon:yes gene_type:complete